MTTSESSEQLREFPRYEVNAYVDYTGSEVSLFHRIQNIPARRRVHPDLGRRRGRHGRGSGLSTSPTSTPRSPCAARSRANREPPMDMGIRYIDLDEERKDTLRKYINLVRK